MMRKILSRCVAAVAGVVYGLGVSLYRLSDRLDGWNEEDEAPQVHLWTGDNTTTTWTTNWRLHRQDR